MLDWDEREGVLRAERQRKVGELVLDSRACRTGRGRTWSRAARSGAAQLELLAWTPELRQWQARIALLRGLDLQQRG